MLKLPLHERQPAACRLIRSLKLKHVPGCCCCCCLQIHWVFGAKLLNQSVTLANASLNLLHEDAPAAGGGRGAVTVLRAQTAWMCVLSVAGQQPSVSWPGHDTHTQTCLLPITHAPTLLLPSGPATHIMETMEGTAVYPPSLMQHVNGLVIPGGQDAYTARYSCAKVSMLQPAVPVTAQQAQASVGSGAHADWLTGHTHWLSRCRSCCPPRFMQRCTYVPLGGLSPRPVHIAGYTFHGHHFMQSKPGTACALAAL